MPTTIRLDPEIEARIDRLAEKTGRTRSFYLKRLIEDNLADLEDICLAEQRLEDLRAGKTETIASEELWRDL